MNINEHFNAQHFDFENNFPIVTHEHFNVGHFSIIFPIVAHDHINSGLFPHSAIVTSLFQSQILMLS